MGLFSKLKDRLAKVQQENRENAGEKTAPKEIFDRMRQKIEETQKKAATKRGRTRKKSSGSIFSQLKDKLAEAQKENEASQKEETADTSILDRVTREVEKLEKKKKPIEIETMKEETPPWGSPIGVPAIDDILGRVMESTKKEKEKAKEKATPKKEEDFGSIFDQIMGSDKPKASTAKKTSTKKSVPVSDFGDIFDKIVTPGSSQSASSSASGGGDNDDLYVGGTGLVDGKGGSLSIRKEPNMGASTLRSRLPDNVNVRILDHTDQNAINIDGQTAGWYKVDYEGKQGWILDIYLE